MLQVLSINILEESDFGLSRGNIGVIQLILIDLDVGSMGQLTNQLQKMC